MDWLQVFTLFFANASLIMWFRTETRNDWRHMDNKLEAYRRETKDMIKSIQEETKAIHEEMKDFHNRLYSLEEKHKNKK